MSISSRHKSNFKPFTLQQNQLIIDANAALDKEDFISCEKLCRKILALNPKQDTALQMLSIALGEQGKLEEALKHGRAAIAIAPQNGHYKNSLANILVKAEQLIEAESLYREAIRLVPESGDAYYNLSKLLLSLKKLNEAEELLQQLLLISPGTTNIYQGLAMCEFHRGRFEKAILWLKLAQHTDPSNVDVLHNLAVCHQEAGLFYDAIEIYNRVLEVDPYRHEVLLGLIHCQFRTHNIPHAEALTRAYIEHDFPDKLQAEMFLSSILKVQGKHSETLAIHKKLTTEHPQHALLYSNMLLDSVYSDELNQETLFDLHREFDRRYSLHQTAAATLTHQNQPDPYKKIKIGYVSSDFNDHAVAYFSMPLILRHDRTHFEVHCYYTRASFDAVTEHFRQNSIFHQIDVLNEWELADQIKKDGIDILVDLSGHTGGNRLTTFSLKPAPIQISWLGYPFSTGLSTMDYRIVDEIVEPIGMTEHLNTEKLIRLPGCFLANRPCTGHPHRKTSGELDVKELPAIQNGYITFGTCNNVAKLTDFTLGMWAKILDRVPNSKLIIESVDPDNPHVRESFNAKFTKNGIDMARVILSNRAKNPQYTLYHQFDIALDPFPCNGGTTTCDALWMGVPVVSLEGERFMSRMGATFLINIGHPEWLASTPEQYIEIAVNLASDTSHLSQIRQHLRQEMEESPLMDEVGFARRMERAYRDVWQQWCTTQIGAATHQLENNPQETTAQSSDADTANENGSPEEEKAILAAYEKGELDQVISLSHFYLDRHPKQSGIRHLLGLALLTKKEPDAIAELKHCTETSPDEPTFHNSLGNAFIQQGLLDDAASCYRQAIRLKPDLAEAHYNLAYCLTEQGQRLSLASPEANALMDEAISCYQATIEILPQHALSWNNLGHLHMYRNRIQEAEIAIRRALKYDPDMPDALINLGIIYQKQMKTTQAIETTEKSIARNPNNASAYNNLATYCTMLGETEEALKWAEKAVQLDPACAEWHDTYLLTQLYAETPTDDVRKKAYQQYAQAIEAPLQPNWQPHANRPDPERKLKVGYVSGDFRHHSAAYFFMPFFNVHDHGKFETFFYYTGDQFDSITRKLHSTHADHWRNVRGINAETLAALIQDDQIDILIDLAGHTMHNALAAFAYKPAPVQVTWLGYPDTTGLHSIDYRITDHVGDPIGLATETFYTEKLYRLPVAFAVYQPYVVRPEQENMPVYQVQDTPALNAGHITFGSASSIARLTRSTIRQWANVILAVPNSVLKLESTGLSEARTKNRLLAEFAACGVTEEKIIFLPRDPARQYRIYHDFDIALDAFPSNGGTTTFDALWMGVPVITKAGVRFASRIGASTLTHLGHPEWIASSNDEFVKIACELAKDVEKLNQIRHGLRAEMQNSPLMDAVTFTRAFEQGLQEMWRTWCVSEEGQNAKSYHEHKEAIALCQSLLEAGDYSSAMDGYRHMLSRWSNSAQALYGMGLTALLQGDASMAHPILERAATALQQQTGDSALLADCLAALGQLYLNRGEVEAATLHFQHSLAIKESEHVRLWLEELGETGASAVTH